MTTKTAKKSANKTAAKKPTNRLDDQSGIDAAVEAASADHEADDLIDIEAAYAALQKRCDDLESKSKSAQRRLKAKRKIMHDAALEHRDADQHRKDCKAAFDKARMEYIKEADAIADGQELLPFPPEKSADAAEVPLLQSAKATIEGKAKGLPKGFIEKCSQLEPAVLTVPDLERLMDKGGLQAMKGVGETMVDKVSDWVFAYREENPIPAPDEPDPPASESHAETNGVAHDQHEAQKEAMASK